jgi:hypothetical protein
MPAGAIDTLRGAPEVARYFARFGVPREHWEELTGWTVKDAWRYFREYGFPPPDRWFTLTYWEHILDTIDEHRLWALDADFAEIGVFLGGGTYQLARLLERHAPERRVYAVDIFDPDFDVEATVDGIRMADIYRMRLEGRDQREMYSALVEGCPNVVTLAGDSAAIELPTDRIAFAHIDGNHHPDYVRGDFEMIWALTVPGGVVAFDDYGHALPEVTAAVDELVAQHETEIQRFWTGGEKTAFVKRR